MNEQLLLVEDDDAIADALRIHLEQAGYRLHREADGLRAIGAIDRQRWDLVLLDLTMPRMDGREALRALRQLRPDLPVILSSGYSDQDFIQNLASEKGVTFLQKPYLLANLRQAVQALLR